MGNAIEVLRQCPRLTDEQILQLLEQLKPHLVETLRGILGGNQIHSFGGAIAFHARLEKEGEEDLHADLSLNLLVVMAAEPTAGVLMNMLRGRNFPASEDIEPEKKQPEGTRAS